MIYAIGWLTYLPRHTTLQLFISINIFVKSSIYILCIDLNLTSSWSSAKLRLRLIIYSKQTRRYIFHCKIFSCSKVNNEGNFLVLKYFPALICLMRKLLRQNLFHSQITSRSFRLFFTSKSRIKKSLLL